VSRRDPLARVTEAQVMRATEAALQLAQARRIIGLFWRTNSGGLGQRADGTLRPLRSTPGLGDWTVILAHGTHAELECKRPRGAVWSEAQRVHAQRVVRAHGAYAIVRSGDEAMRALEAMAAGCRWWTTGGEEIDR
jgi:hypothetical protein